MLNVRLLDFWEDKGIELSLLVLPLLVVYLLYQYNKFHVGCHVILLTKA